MRYAIIDGSNVTNVIEWDGEEPYETSDGSTLQSCPPEVSVGWTFDGSDWAAPILPDPEPNPLPYEDPAVTAAKNSALAQLVGLGITEANARLIVGLPPA